MSVKGKFSPEQLAELERVAQSMDGALDELRGRLDAICSPFAYTVPPELLADLESCRADAPERSEPVRRRRDPAILRDPDTGKLLRVVTQQTAAEYSGVGIRILSRHIKIGKIVAEGGKANVRVLVKSLLDFYPPEK